MAEKNLYRLCKGEKEECKEWPSFCYKNGGPCKWTHMKDESNHLTFGPDKFEKILVEGYELYFEVLV